MKKKQKHHFTGKKWIAALVVVVLILAAIYYYIALPAINIHNPELWKFVLFLAVIIFALYALPKTTFTGDRRHPVNFSGNYKTKTFKFLASLIVVIAAAYFVGTLLSSPVINASCSRRCVSDRLNPVFSNCKCEEISEADEDRKK